VFHPLVSKLMPLVLLLAATSNPIVAKQNTISTSSLTSTIPSLNCCGPDPTCPPDQSCAVSATLIEL
jgi:hypothetical protein